MLWRLILVFVNTVPKTLSTLFAISLNLGSKENMSFRKALNVPRHHLLDYFLWKVRSFLSSIVTFQSACVSTQRAWQIMAVQWFCQGMASGWWFIRPLLLIPQTNYGHESCFMLTAPFLTNVDLFRTPWLANFANISKLPKCFPAMRRVTLTKFGLFHEDVATVLLY